MAIWYTDDVESLIWQKQIYNKAHDAEINNVTSTNINNIVYVISFCLNGELKIWKGYDLHQNLNLEYVDKLLFGSNLQEAFKIFPMNQRYLTLLTGGFDKYIHVYTIDTQNDSEEVIQYHTSLIGHTNSIRDYCVTKTYKNNLKYIFSCSQDCLIRVWKLVELSQEEEQSKIEEEQTHQFEHLKTKTSYILHLGDGSIFNITLSSVLQHHSSSVSSVRIYEDPDISLEDPINSILLLSSSFDFTVCIWKIDQDTGVWSVDTTLGEMSGNKHAFFGAEFLSKDHVFAYTYNGAFHRWQNIDDLWLVKPCVTGHFNEVRDLDWDLYRDYLVTTSKDQTTRIISKCKSMNRWCEISRPQVHGYDINCVAFLKSKQLLDAPEGMKFGPHVVAGADEKILRLFDPPYSFVKSANKYNQDTLRFVKDMTNEEVEQNIIGKMNEVASMTLGLMNKPMMPKKNMRTDEDDTGHTVEDFDPDVLTNQQKDISEDIIVEDKDNDIMLTEEYLMNKSRWPERNKLYGHAYEIY